MSLPYKVNLSILATPNEMEHAARLKDIYDIVGSHFKEAAIVASTGNLAGTYAATPMTLTATANGALIVDGITTLAVADRVLLPNQTDKTENGIYVVTTLGDGSTPWVLTRADDFDSTAEIVSGVKIHVIKGDSYKDSTFVLITDNPTLGGSLEFELDSGKILAVKEKRFTITGDNTTLTFPFTHNYNTRAVTVDVIEASGNYETVYTDVLRQTDNAITVGFAIAPLTTESYLVIVRAEV